MIQVPPTIIAILLVQWRLHLPAKHDNTEDRWAKLKRIDYLGATFLCYFIFAGCFVLDSGGQRMAWSSPGIVALTVSGTLSLALFVFSGRHVPEPIFPLRLLVHFDVVTNYLVVTLQTMQQVSLMMSVPLFFQATQRATTAEAGAYLIPAFLGNTIGGLTAGHWIKCTGRYKLPTVLAPILSLGCMVACLLLWGEHTNIWESLLSLPGGLAMGLASSSAFVGLAAGVPEEDIAIAGSGMYLCFNIGAIAGVSIGSAVYQTALRKGLSNVLPSGQTGTKIMEGLLSSIDYLDELEPKLRRLAVSGFVMAFHAVNVFGFCCSAIAVVVAVISRERRLKR